MVESGTLDRSFSKYITKGSPARCAEGRNSTSFKSRIREQVATLTAGDDRSFSIKYSYVEATSNGVTGSISSDISVGRGSYREECVSRETGSLYQRNTRTVVAYSDRVSYDCATISTVIANCDVAGASQYWIFIVSNSNVESAGRRVSTGISCCSCNRSGSYREGSSWVLAVSDGRWWNIHL